ncbi:hypothetical protein Tco_0004957 [Tanacetum coccineum]
MSLGSCGIANLAILQLGKVVEGEGKFLEKAVVTVHRLRFDEQGRSCFFSFLRREGKGVVGRESRDGASGESLGAMGWGELYGEVWERGDNSSRRYLPGERRESLKDWFGNGEVMGDKNGGGVGNSREDGRGMLVGAYRGGGGVGVRSGVTGREQAEGVGGEGGEVLGGKVKGLGWARQWGEAGGRGGCGADGEGVGLGGAGETGGCGPGGGREESGSSHGVNGGWGQRGAGVRTLEVGMAARWKW